jgi:hypothetical protein
LKPSECGDDVNEVDEVDHELTDREHLNLFYNDFAKHVAFLKLKISEAYALPISVTGSLFTDLQTVVDLFQQYFTDIMKRRLQNMGVLWTEDALLHQMLSSESIFERCPFAALTTFNPVLFFPPDIMHDVLEGLMPVVIGVVVKSLVRTSNVSIKVINERITGFTFGVADKSDKFVPFPLDFVSKDKSVTGKAVEKWTLFRLLPLVVGDLVPENSEFWKLYLLSREICDIVLAPVIDPAWLPYLEVIISHHHALLRDIAPKAFIPKIHFITHYPRLLHAFGPLRHLWAMRFEAMHQFFKQLIHKTRSHINVTATLSGRFQRKKCYEIASNSCMLSSVIMHSAQCLIQSTKLPSGLLNVLMEQWGVKTADQLLSVRSITDNGVKYVVGCVYVYDVVHTEEVPVFVKVSHILQLEHTWHVCGTLYEAVRFDAHLHAYCVKTDDKWVVFEARHTIDSQCLSLYNTGRECMIILRHRVSGSKNEC